jgi:Holliday junction resolvasome RuvABC endonuclease subunit
MTPYSVAGVDYGTRRIAITVISEKSVELYEIDLSGTDNHVKDIAVLSDYLTDVLIKHKPTLVAIEQPIQGASRNVRVGLLMGMVAGALSVAANHTGASVAIVAPATWKKSVIGRGNADKQSVSDWLERQHPRVFERCNKSQDLVDSTCLALHAEKILER